MQSPFKAKHVLKFVGLHGAHFGPFHVEANSQKESYSTEKTRCSTTRFWNQEYTSIMRKLFHSHKNKALEEI